MLTHLTAILKQVLISLVSQLCRFAQRERFIEFALQKKEPGNFWPRLISGREKFHWLKTDFDKWKEEEEFEEKENPGTSLEDVRGHP